MAAVVHEASDMSGEHRLPPVVLKGLMVVFALGALVIAVDVVREGPRWNTVGMTAISLAWLVYLGYLLQSPTVVEPTGLRVRTGWSWRHIPWHQIASFSHSPAGVVVPALVTVRTVDDRTFRTQLPEVLRPALDRYIVEHAPCTTEAAPDQARDQARDAA
jgi:hypothetical protein